MGMLGDGTRRRPTILVRTFAVVLVIGLLAGGMVALILNARRSPNKAGAPSVPSVGTPTAPTPSVEASSPTPSAASTASPTAPRCHNSTDPACGAFSWTRDPGPNAALRITVATSPAHPRAGDVVTFRVHVVDPDAPVVCCDIFSSVWGASGQSIVKCTRGPHGPWDPPAKRRGEENLTFTHRFDKAGDFTIRFAGGPSRSCADGSPPGSTVDGRPVNPYLSSGSSTVVVRVTAAGTATPTPTPSETASPSPSETATPYPY